MPLPYAVVSFSNDDSDDEQVTSEVPSCWLTPNNTKCWWPKTKNISAFMVKKVLPDTEDPKWELYDVIFENYFESLEKARKKAESISSSDEQNIPDRKRIQRKKKSMSQKKIIGNSDSEQEMSCRNMLKKIPDLPHNYVTNNSMQFDIENIPVIYEETDEPKGYPLTQTNMTFDCQAPTSKKSDSISIRTLNCSPVKTFCAFTMTSSTDKPHETLTQNDSLKTTRNVPKVLSQQVLTKAPIETEQRLLVAPSSSLPVYDAITTSLPLYTSNRSDAYTQDRSESLVRIIEDNFNKLFKKVAEIAVEVKSLTASLNKLQTRFHDDTDTPASAELLMITDSLPFPTIDKLKDFEYQLEINATLKSSVGSYFKRIGGSGAKDTTLRILRRVFSNAVAQNCSWLGLRDNFSVQNLAIIKITKDAVMVNYNMTDKEFEETCSEWFRQGKQRFIREEKAKAKARA
ncbi:uncharacterized protein [Neodiprion pinetum]|uniref:Uncharacterized protein LOC124293676 isoform X2 n=1 Tax=Neodiprion lecontei TaxID=441921 RepID=A0ABM3FU41_NEOLC|nr:uncharacterized protein LOC124185019 isoform X2 [Neodiprion fabricii]XP_046435616.1 uncharacterized protein LOC124187273 isoform X2 [Neodiprion fabricii]XP_046473666.1 uncharacterized protein LOC124214936 isoform X2 [Neodiprion pinetum]XP_046476614.1 uncharacterized protein LOC124216310 isoform X2 [Neodiprion pinetum]XP_046591536.1 uncharacterized protein LOC124293676 isoform X2 [Neodiprion lecontei]XP_046597290.1 uncharacterized protein LOC124294711 isoform X3 [Neodiprion lecontei]XP_0465